VTIPYKSAVLGLVDEVEDIAKDIGAVNTIYRDEHGQVIGANTDAPATVACTEQVAGTIHNKRVLILGAGGVGRAIAFAMQAAGGTVTIANRSVDKAEALAEEVGCSFCSLTEALEQTYDILINGTSVGMGTADSPWPADRHRPDSIVFDTVYTPLETRLLHDASQRSCQTICGLSMLIRQALGQFERWTGLEAPAPLMQRMALEHLGMDWPEGLCCQNDDSGVQKIIGQGSSGTKRSATELIQ
ncbi:MAG: shikimate dehydrogenase, partial [Okeania sp. SIO2C9]|uniref:shikimate dehydrogenase family protein n=1 Tax=Okeania sp. SIO2C9 TaxID=2607791 RepID=UPI0013C29761